MINNFKICLLGYTNENGNTCWYPWNRFFHVFKHLGYEVEWGNIENLTVSEKPTIFITWNHPDALSLIQNKKYVKGKDVILQKVVGGSPRFKTPPYGNSVHEADKFFLTHDFPDYKMCLDLFKDGHNIYAFGARTSNKETPAKKQICEALGDRMIMIPWGSCLYSYEEIQKANPILSDFKYDIGYVGSFWGNSNIGSLNNVNLYLRPLLGFCKKEKIKISGEGTGFIRCSNEDHKMILKKSSICPIINSDSWKSMRGVQDRFWSVFSSGRFGVCDSEGVYEFFNEDEVVVETDPNEYILKSIYFMKNVDKQEKYILNALERIKKEYNYYNTWENIINKVGKDL